MSGHNIFYRIFLQKRSSSCRLYLVKFDSNKYTNKQTYTHTHTRTHLHIRTYTYGRARSRTQIRAIEFGRKKSVNWKVFGLGMVETESQTNKYKSTNREWDESKIKKRINRTMNECENWEMEERAGKRKTYRIVYSLYIFYWFSMMPRMYTVCVCVRYVYVCTVYTNPNPTTHFRFQIVRANKQTNERTIQWRLNEWGGE